MNGRTGIVNERLPMKPSLFMVRCLCLLSMLTLNAACVTQAPRIIGADRVGGASELRDWTASGRLGVSGTAQSGSGGFTWIQEDALSSVQVRGPVGVGSLRIDMEGERLSMRSSDGVQYDAEQVLAELEVRLGVALPIARLRYWLLGLAAPGAHRWSVPERILEQDGWLIEYGEWLQRAPLRLPARLILTRERLRLVIVVQQWQLMAVRDAAIAVIP